MKMKSGGGGGYGSSVRSNAPKVEPKSKAISPGGVSQAGVSTAFKKENVVFGRGYEPAPMPATGVKGTFNSASQGPGSGRTVYGSGSQSPTLQAKEMPKGRDTLSEYGKDIPGRR
jgi:hypothetical protein